jgi:ATP-dependent protease ClpP protease subunit
MRITKKTNGIHDGKQTFPTIFCTPLGNRYTVNITSDFDSSDTYDEVVALLSNATEMDELIWNISSYGGYVNSLQMLLGWKNMCVAKQTHVLHSNADSCASAFFLSDADSYVVGDGATMFCHEIQAGVGGTTSNMSRHMEHLKKTNEDFIKRTYQNFLNETEIDEILKGVEVFLTADEIRERLQHREEMKGKKLQQDIQDQLNTPVDLSEHSTESLEEELKLLELDKKDIQAELRKRKKASPNSN